MQWKTSNDIIIQIARLQHVLSSRQVVWANFVLRCRQSSSGRTTIKPFITANAHTTAQRLSTLSDREKYFLFHNRSRIDPDIHVFSGAKMMMILSLVFIEYKKRNRRENSSTFFLISSLVLIDFSIFSSESSFCLLLLKWVRHSRWEWRWLTRSS